MTTNVTSDEQLLYFIVSITEVDSKLLQTGGREGGKQFDSI